MPELPEVETIKNELIPYVVGRKITDVKLFWDRIVRTPSVDEFTRGVVGQEITGLSRRGKYLFFHLGSGKLLVMHMKMTVIPFGRSNLFINFVQYFSCWVIKIHLGREKCWASVRNYYIGVVFCFI